MSDISNMIVSVDGGDALPLAEFLEINEFSEQERTDIVLDLMESGKHEGGGGASADYIVRIVNP